MLADLFNERREDLGLLLSDGQIIIDVGPDNRKFFLAIEWHKLRRKFLGIRSDMMRQTLDNQQPNYARTGRN